VERDDRLLSTAQTARSGPLETGTRGGATRKRSSTEALGRRAGKMCPARRSSSRQT
jgi:hypothetical protein